VRHAHLALIVVAMAVLPWILGSYFVTLLNYIGMSALAALGLVLLTGVGGLTSFGQAAFVGIGAYATAWLTTVEGASPWLGLLLAIVATAAVAALLGAAT
jgi:branched-chain amino acid transport system permease protein